MNFLVLLQKREDVVLALAMVSIIAVMLLPMPPFLLDLLLTVSISLSVTILITSIYIKKPLEFSVLPSVLLMAVIGHNRISQTGVTKMWSAIECSWPLLGPPHS